MLETLRFNFKGRSRNGEASSSRRRRRRTNRRRRGRVRRTTANRTGGSTASFSERTGPGATIDSGTGRNHASLGGPVPGFHTAMSPTRRPEPPGLECRRSTWSSHGVPVQVYFSPSEAAGTRTLK